MDSDKELTMVIQSAIVAIFEIMLSFEKQIRINLHVNYEIDMQQSRHITLKQSITKNEFTNYSNNLSDNLLETNNVQKTDNGLNPGIVMRNALKQAIKLLEDRNSLEKEMVDTLAADIGLDYVKQWDWPNENRRENEKYKCKYCSEDFSIINNLKKHEQNCKNVNVKQNSAIEIETEAADNEQVFKCDICEREFRLYQNLGRHLLKIHKIRVVDQEMKKGISCANQGKGGYVCNLCGHRFSFQSNLSRHFAKVHKRCPKARRLKAKVGQLDKSSRVNDRARHKCELCDCRFTFRSNLNRHMNKVHRKRSPIPVPSKMNKSDTDHQNDSTESTPSRYNTSTPNQKSSSFNSHKNTSNECSPHELNISYISPTLSTLHSNAPYISPIINSESPSNASLSSMNTSPYTASVSSSYTHSQYISPVDNSNNSNNSNNNSVSPYSLHLSQQSDMAPQVLLPHSSPHTNNLSTVPSFSAFQSPLFPQTSAFNPPLFNHLPLKPLQYSLASPTVPPPFNTVSAISTSQANSSVSPVIIKPLGYQYHCKTPPTSTTVSMLSTSPSETATVITSSDITPPTTSVPFLRSSITTTTSTLPLLTSQLNIQNSSIITTSTTTTNFMPPPPPPLPGTQSNLPPTPTNHFLPRACRKYGCTVCGQMFSFESNVKRHFMSQHKTSKDSSMFHEIITSSPVSTLPSAEKSPNTNQLHSPLSSPSSSSSQDNATSELSKTVKSEVTPAKKHQLNNKKKDNNTKQDELDKASTKAKQKTNTESKKSKARRFICCECQASFTFRTNLTRHMRQKHADKKMAF